MPVVEDYRAILGYLDNPASRWNATEDLGFPVIVTYSFLEPQDLPATTQVAFPSSTVETMSTQQRDAVRRSMDLFEEAAGITFVETTGDAMVELYTVTGSGYGGWAYLPFVTPGLTFDSQVVLDVTRGDLLQGHGFDIITHELGHAVGLSHPHEGTYTLTPRLDSANNTIESYNRAAAPQLDLPWLDLQALDHLYGEPVDTSDWVFGFNGRQFEVTASASDDQILGVVGDNKLKGLKGDDVIIGREDADIINGGDGDDVLVGGIGQDVLRGGNGKDHLYAGAADGQFNDFFSNKLVGGKGGDALFGSSGRDFLTGELGRDQISGGGGNDTLVGGKETDRLTGGDGSDTFIFFARTDGDRDVVTDFTFWQDTLDIRQIDVSRDEIVLKQTADPDNVMLKINHGEDLPFRILFLDTELSDLETYFDSYHTYDVMS